LPRTLGARGPKTAKERIPKSLSYEEVTKLKGRWKPAIIGGRPKYKKGHTIRLGRPAEIAGNHVKVWYGRRLAIFDLHTGKFQRWESIKK
jgi:hypothetical protein